MRIHRTGRPLAGALLILLAAARIAAADDYLWQGYAENPQHTSLSAVASQPLADIRWTTSEDQMPTYSGGELFIHYGSPMIAPGNVMVVPVKTTSTGGFEVQGVVGSTGAVAWTATSDYVVPATGSWFPPYSPTFTPSGLLYYPGAGGSVYRANVALVGTLAPTRLNFYGSSITAAPDSHIYIDTPITSDSAGNIYFGYQVIGTPSASFGVSMIAALGTGGIARISANGVATYVSAAAAAGDASMAKVVQNCAPAITADGGALYIAVNSGPNGTGYLLKLDSATLATEGKVAAKNPQTGGNAIFHDSGTASPTIGPDGDVYMGVFDGTSRGWLEHYSSDLATTKTPGGFGWDNTASIVPASMVPSYHGGSSYLLMTKYNNYVETGGGGQNMIAILDPNSSMIDNQRTNSTGATIMKTVLTKLGPTPNAEGGVYEWCDNDAVVDPATGSVLVTSEDGHLYRWNLATNTLSETMTLGGGLGEAYTPTLIGPDGTVFALNNGLLHAIGLPLTSWTGAAGGTWNASAASWSSGSPAAATTFSSGAVLAFGDANPLTGQQVPNSGGTATITVQAGGVQPGWMTFTNTGAAAGGVDYSLGGGPIGGSGGITLAGTGGVGGRVTLTSANSFSGGVAVIAGRLNVQNSAALGNSAGVSIYYGAGLELQSLGGSPVVFGLTAVGTSVPLSLAGPGPSSGGALRNVSGNNVFAGPISIGLASGGATVVSASSDVGDGLALTGGITVAPGTSLTVSGPGPTSISNGRLALASTTFDGPAGLIVAGPGTVEIASPPTLGHSSHISVGAGKLRFNVTAGGPTIGCGVTAVVSQSATLELAGSVSALSAGATRVDVTNNSSANGVLVTGTHQQTGAIDGNGATKVAAGGDLAADHIIQSALIIAGSAGNPASLTIAASDSTGSPLDRPAASNTALLPAVGIASDGTQADQFSASEQPLVPLDQVEPAVNSASVPEPGSLALMAMAFGLAAFSAAVLAKRRNC